MTPENLSKEVQFVNMNLNSDKINGGFESNKDLAFETETTGVLMQLDGLTEKNLATTADTNLIKTIAGDKVIDEVMINEDSHNGASIHKSLTEEVIVNGDSHDLTTVVEKLKTVSKDLVEVKVESVEYEAIVGDINNILPIWFLELGFLRSNAICLISTSGIDYKNRRGSWQGTGFLISDNILLTNYHVLNSKDVSENAICAFNFQLNEKGKVQTTKNFQLNPARLFISSPHTELDFCFVWIDGEPGKEFGTTPMLRHAFVVKEKDFANIIQHPGGKVKSIALQNNQIIAQSETVVHYETDTLAGSSGAVVSNNEWKAFALHHASKELKPADIVNNIPAVYINEGIKLSAIAAYLESISDNGRNKSAAEVLRHFQDTDAMLGYFGGLGRDKHVENVDDGLERVVKIYKGEAKDIDIAFWNVLWFNKYYKEKLEDIAKVIVRMNLDVWVFEETSPKATKELVKFLKLKYDLDYDSDASEPNASDAKQTTTIIWNKKTVNVEKKKWSDKVEKWLQLDSTDIGHPEDLVLESELVFEKIDGKIFDRYPGLFYLTSKQRDTEDEFNAFIVPLHLKAMGEGSKRRILASKILAAGIKSMIEEEGADSDWILGGDFNATIASEDFNYLLNDFTAISAEDESAGEMTYIKGKYKSLIDHIFLSPNLKNSTDSEYVIVAQDKVLPDYLSISDHRPVLIRLSLKDKMVESNVGGTTRIDNKDLWDTISALEARKKPVKTISKKRPDVDEDVLSKSLKEVEQNKSKEYYNEAKDKKDIQQYYGQIPAQVSGTKMFTWLNDLVTSTHTQVLAYKPGTYLYPWVDLQPDQETILNIYSGDSTTPEALIKSDFESERKVYESFTSKFPDKDGLESTLTNFEADFLEALENSQGFNCEHVVCQSWFGKQNPMKGDLHHLYSCTPNCNSFRNNIPYFEYPDWEEKVMDNCGMREPQGFEPKEGKGKVARATLYFLLRYPRQISQYTLQDVQFMLAWHINEPPSLHEKHRNAAIYELQGNRNPFIDFPKLASKVDFSKGLK